MDAVHVPLLIVQVNVALLPAVIPVTPEVAEAGVVIVAVPEVTDQRPVPVLGELPAKVNDAVLHCSIALPALEVVGVEEILALPVAMFLVDAPVDVQLIFPLAPLVAPVVVLTYIVVKETEPDDCVNVKDEPNPLPEEEDIS